MREWALNGFFEQEIAGDRGREWGIAQSVVTPIHLFHPAPPPPPPSDHKNVQTKNVQPVAGTAAPTEDFKVGIECQFRSFSDKFSRGTPYNSFVIGPTADWKPTRRLRFDVSPLFGVNHKSPIMQLFVVASYLWGPGGPSREAGGEAPASLRPSPRTRYARARADERQPATEPVSYSRTVLSVQTVCLSVSILSRARGNSRSV